jgi:hypothetical protein
MGDCREEILRKSKGVKYKMNNYVTKMYDLMDETLKRIEKEAFNLDGDISHIRKILSEYKMRKTIEQDKYERESPSLPKG